MQTTVAQRLVEARQFLDLSQRNFAEPLDVSNVTITHWEAGRHKLSKSSAVAIQQVHGISADWLLNGTGKMMVTEPESGSRLKGAKRLFNKALLAGLEFSTGDVVKPVPMLAAEPGTGNGSTLNDYVAITGVMARFFDRQWLRESFGVSPDNLCLLQVTGDNMEPTINHNELIFVDGLHNIPEYRDGVWILRLGGELCVRRVQRLANNQFKVTCDNPAYRPFELDESAKLLGRVVGSSRRL